MKCACPICGKFLEIEFYKLLKGKWYAKIQCGPSFATWDIDHTLYIVTGLKKTRQGVIDSLFTLLGKREP